MRSNSPTSPLLLCLFFHFLDIPSLSQSTFRLILSLPTREIQLFFLFLPFLRLPLFPRSYLICLYLLSHPFSLPYHEIQLASLSLPSLSSNHFLVHSLLIIRNLPPHPLHLPTHEIQPTSLPLATLSILTFPHSYLPYLTFPPCSTPPTISSTLSYYLPLSSCSPSPSLPSHEI